MEQEEQKAMVADDKVSQGKKRRQHGEADPLPLKLALRRGKSALKTVFNLLHYAEEINGLDSGEKFHARGDLEDAKNTLVKIQQAISRSKSFWNRQERS